MVGLILNDLLFNIINYIMVWVIVWKISVGSIVYGV